VTGPEVTPDARAAAANVRTAALAAADEIYTAHAPLLRKIAAFKFKIPAEDVDSLVHDVFAAYFANAPQVRDLRAYLVGTICNTSRYYWRRRDAEREIFCSPPECPAADEKIADTVSNKLLLARMLSRLREGCRDILKRYYLEGETSDSIAASRDTTRDYVLVLLHNCRKNARNIYRTMTENR
jgi:RNA polymerase sigma factor (sigma-70 family)